jgi:hypothetical protein
MFPLRNTDVPPPNSEWPGRELTRRLSPRAVLSWSRAPGCVSEPRQLHLPANDADHQRVCGIDADCAAIFNAWVTRGMLKCCGYRIPAKAVRPPMSGLGFSVRGFPRSGVLQPVEDPSRARSRPSEQHRPFVRVAPLLLAGRRHRTQSAKHASLDS